MKETCKSEKRSLWLKCESFVCIIALSILLGRIIPLLTFTFLSYDLFLMENLLLSLLLVISYYLFKYIKFSIVRFSVIASLAALSLLISWRIEVEFLLLPLHSFRSDVFTRDIPDVLSTDFSNIDVKPVSVTFFLLDSQNHLSEPMRFSTQDLVATSAELHPYFVSPDDDYSFPERGDYLLKCVVNEETQQKIVAFTKNANMEDLHGIAIFSNGQTVISCIVDPLEKNFFYLAFDFQNSSQVEIEELSHSLMLTIHNNDNQK